MRRILLAIALGAAACGTGNGRAAQDGPDNGDGHAPADPRPPAQTPADTPAVGPLHFTASSAIMESFPVQLRVTAEVTNTGTAAQTLEFPNGCNVLLRVYGNDDAHPVWDQANVTMCTMAIQVFNLGPGERASWATSTDAREILGDSLPDGRYRLRAFMTVNGRAIEIDAGSADLGVPR